MSEDSEEIEEIMASAASLMDRVPEGVGIEEMVSIELPEETDMISSDIFEIIPEDDGAVVVDFDPTAEYGPPEDFYSNLAENIDDSGLGSISSQLMEEYESNRGSRKDWEEAYSKGLELLGFNYEERTEPFAGATGVTHPLLAEAATQFQAQAFNELLPASGPVRTHVLGQVTKDKDEQSRRVGQFMNYYITNVMEEYTPELDQMLFYLPLAGSTFKKVYYDSGLDRAVSKFVAAENLVVPYEANDLETCPNITHVVRMSMNDLRKKQIAGFYRDIKVLPAQAQSNTVIEEVDKIDGVSPSNVDYDCTLLECHVDLDLEGYEDKDADGEDTGIRLPYLVTISQDNGKILSIRRNYEENDPIYKKIQYFVHYKFLPGFGFYGLGLIHTIGGLSRTATAALRQLIDAGTLSNLPAGFKARGLRIRDDDSPLKPGEFRDVDAPGGAIRDSLMPLPFKGPDPTLFQLLGFVVQAGQRFATITDLKVGDGNQSAAVGTTIAMMEQGSRVMSAVHKRLHYAMRIEFKLLARVMSVYLPQEYPYSVRGGDQSVYASDFDGRVDIVPISDPNIFSQAQRITLAQTEIQLAMQAPEIHNMYEVYRRMYEALQVRDIDSILLPPSSTETVSKDPAQENIDTFVGTILKAFEGQDHQSHIMAHMIFGATPMAAQIPKITMDLQKHIMEHVQIQATEQAFQTFQQQSGRPPQQGDEVSFEALKSQFIAQGMQQLKVIGTQINGEDQPPVDPVVQLKEQELQIKQQKNQADNAIDQAELQLDSQKQARKAQEFDLRQQNQNNQTQAKIQAAFDRETLRQQKKG
jgi:hypothetical protein